MLESGWPDLKNIAMTVLAQCPSSSPSERNWSAYDFVHSKVRNRLTPQRAQKLVNVIHNLTSLKHATVREREKMESMEVEAQRAMELFVAAESDECSSGHEECESVDRN
jgi:hypothetical protein